MRLYRFYSILMPWELFTKIWIQSPIRVLVTQNLQKQIFMLFIEVMPYASQFHLMFMVCIQHLFAYASLVKGENILFLDCKIHKRSFFLNSIFSLFEAIFIFFACHELINTIPFVISCFQIKLYRFYSDIDVFGIDSPNKFC